MRFISIRDGDRTSLCVVEGDAYVRVEPTAGASQDILAMLELGQDLVELGRRSLESGAPRHALAEAAFAPVVPRPGKVICLGLNYYDHAKEGGREKPDYPWFFMRAATSLVAHGAAAIKPRVSDKFDYEAELAVVIGRRARHVSRADALKYVLGYACFNDMSVRDYQKKTPQWTIGKNFDGTGSFGPVLVTPDELPAAASGLKIELRLNGQVLQSANTSDMIFGVAETIELLTECMTLEAGDVLVMGTPAGVGFARTPPVWMKHGDQVVVSIDRVGELVNTIEAEPAES